MAMLVITRGYFFRLVTMIYPDHDPDFAAWYSKWFTRTSLGYEAAWLAPKILWTLAGFCWTLVRFASLLEFRATHLSSAQDYISIMPRSTWVILGRGRVVECTIQILPALLGIASGASLHISIFMQCVRLFPPTTTDELAGMVASYWPMSP